MTGDSAGLVALGTAVMDRADPAARVVMVLPEGSDVRARLRARIGVGRLFVHEPASTLPSSPRPLVALSDRDADTERLRPGIWPGTHRSCHVRLRRIDTLYDRHQLALLILADPAGAARVLRGAAATIARCAPVVLLDLRDTAPAQAASLRDAVIAALPGYRWMNTHRATPCALPPGVPALPRGLRRDTPPRLEVAFDSLLRCTGLHLPEPEAPLGGRWTGASYHTAFLLPRPGQGEWHLGLDIADWGNVAAGCDAIIGGQRLRPSELGAARMVYGPFQVALSAESSLQVQLLPPRPMRDLRRGPRRIGLRLLRAVLFRHSLAVS